MAVFRKVHTSFWEDEKVVDEFTPEDRFFMLYLLTNSHSNQIGCYSITIRQMEFETGYNRDSILKLINRFTNVLKLIEYSEETKEILILNWYKYNWSNSPKVLACLSKEYENIKNKDFQYSINTLSKQYGYNIDTKSQKEKEKEKEKEEEKEEEEEKDKIKNFEKPTKEEIKKYANQQLGKYINEDEFYKWYDAQDWLDKNGFPVNWKQKVQSWVKRNKEDDKEINPYDTEGYNANV